MERFWSKVEKTKTCWLWTGFVNEQGYGSFTLHGKSLRTHRLAYELSTGENPGKLLVCHTCDNPSCVRPSHLFLGTYTDNARDMATKLRGRHQQKTHCKNGHLLCEDNIYRNGLQRVCKTCKQKNNHQTRIRHGRYGH